MTRSSAIKAEGLELQSSPTAQVGPTHYPYRPSLVNAVVDRVRSSPLAAWVIYGTVGVLLLGLEIAVHWTDSTFPGGFGVIHIMLPVYAMLVLPALHVMDDVAARALAETRPLLNADEDTYRTLQYRLTHLPAYRTPLAGIGGLLTLLLLTLVQPVDTYARLHIMTSPLVSAIEWSFQILLWFGAGIVTYHIIHQMLIVNEVYTLHTRVSLFTLGPFYAFSHLTAANALFTVAVVAVASLALSSLAGTVQWALVGGGALLMAGATFVAPLWGAHRLLAEEKTRQLDRLGQRVEQAIAALQARMDNSELAGVSDLKTALDGLVVGKKELDAISVWPWQPETLRGVVTALVAPVVIWLITKVLERLVIS